MTSIDKIEKALHDLSRGSVSIAECECELENICIADAIQCNGLDERLERYTYLKRYCWRRLLKITK